MMFSVQVVLPTRKGQVYVYDSPKPEQQDEYDIPRHLLPAGPQEIYDVPTRCLVNNYSPEVCNIMMKQDFNAVMRSDSV